MLHLSGSDDTGLTFNSTAHLCFTIIIVNILLFAPTTTITAVYLSTCTYVP